MISQFSNFLLAHPINILTFSIGGAIAFTLVMAVFNDPMDCIGE